MIIKARINGENGHIFKLCSWDSTNFDSNPLLRIQSSDLTEVKNVFSHVESIEIYVSENLVAAYSQYDAYSTISYVGEVFVQHENIFAECMEVGLKRTSLASEVADLRNKVEPVIDIEAMTVDEYRDYLLKQVGAACRQEIYDGTQVELPSTGAIEKYTYNDDDQKNLTNAMAILIIAPELPMIPYHPSGGMCRMIPSLDLLTIYGTLQVRLTYLTTRCNFMNIWIRSIKTKEELLEINWNTDLPQEYQTRVDDIYSQSLAIMNQIKQRFLPQEEETNATQES